MIVKAEGPSGRAKVNSDGPQYALGQENRGKQDIVQRVRHRSACRLAAGRANRRSPKQSGRCLHRRSTLAGSCPVPNPDNASDPGGVHKTRRCRMTVRCLLLALSGHQNRSDGYLLSGEYRTLRDVLGCPFLPHNGHRLGMPPLVLYIADGAATWPC
jgi:hypothetical protein